MHCYNTGMQKITLVAAGAAFGLVVGVLVSGALLNDEHSHEMDIPTSMESHDHDHGDMMMHDHAGVAVLDVAAAPAIELLAEPDTKSGYNLRLMTSNFTFSPEAVGGENIDKQGHAHIYVNDVKIARVYSEWVHVPTEVLVSGNNTVRVTLNANDHSQWEINGELIQAEVVVEG